MRDVSAQLSQPERLKQLEIRRILDTPRDEVFDRITRLCAQTLGTPVALLTFVDDKRQWFKSSYGLAEPWRTRRQTPLSHSFCQYVVADRKPLIVPDARLDPLVHENLAVPEIGVIAYLGVPLFDSEGSVLGSLAVIDSKPRDWSERDVQTMTDFAAVTMIEVQLRTEIAQRMEAEAQLRQAQKLEAIGKLAGGVAHDFGNILLVVQGFASLLKERLVNEPQPLAYLHEIEKAAHRASALTQQLLAFGRKQPLKPKRLCINDVILSLESLLRRTLPGDIELQLDLDRGIGDIEVDPSQLEQVILNLVINARDASTGGDRILVRTLTRVRAPERFGRNSELGWAEMQVQDFGGGIDPQSLPNIFEPFFTTKSEGKGTGLGLATVHGIVNQSNGIVFAESALGQGSTFHVLFPQVANPTMHTLNDRSKTAGDKDFST